MQINQSNLNPCWTDSSVDTGIGHTQTNEQNPHLSQSLKSHGWMRGSTFQKLLKFYIKGVSLKSFMDGKLRQSSCNTYNNNAGLPSKSQY